MLEHHFLGRNLYSNNLNYHYRLLFKVMDTRIHRIIQIQHCSSVTSPTSMQSETVTRNSAQFATVLQQLMSTGILSSKTQNGFPIFALFSQPLGKRPTGFTFGECLFCFIAVMAGTEHRKLLPWRNFYWILSIELVMDFLSLWKRTL